MTVFVFPELDWAKCPECYAKIKNYSHNQSDLESLHLEHLVRFLKQVKERDARLLKELEGIRLPNGLQGLVEVKKELRGGDGK